MDRDNVGQYVLLQVLGRMPNAIPLTRKVTSLAPMSLSAFIAGKMTVIIHCLSTPKLFLSTSLVHKGRDARHNRDTHKRTVTPPEKPSPHPLSPSRNGAPAISLRWEYPPSLQSEARGHQAPAARNAYRAHGGCHDRFFRLAHKPADKPAVKPADGLEPATSPHRNDPRWRFQLSSPQVGLRVCVTGGTLRSLSCRALPGRSEVLGDWRDPAFTVMPPRSV